MLLHLLCFFSLHVLLFSFVICVCGDWGGVVVKTLRSRDWFLVVSLDFSVTYSFRPYHGSGVDSAPNENEYQEHFLGGKGGRCVRLTTSPSSCAECYEIWEPKPPGTVGATPGLLRDSFTFTLFYLCLYFVLFVLVVTCLLTLQISKQ
jgi:hypothetical protein